MNDMVKKMNDVVNKHKITFKDVSDQWLEMKRKDTKTSTYSNYYYTIQKYLKPRKHYITICFQKNDLVKNQNLFLSYYTAIPQNIVNIKGI